LSTFTTRIDEEGCGSRLAVKDLIDVAGVPTTMGSRATVHRAAAMADALCVVAARRVGWRIVGKTNLHEFGYGLSGENQWFGTPENPIDPQLLPGGSSSGSAVAVARGEADAALGTDTGGSVRIPAACCGVVGLKTTTGLVSLQGVQPLAPSCDTVGPMAARVDGIARAMAFLAPAFREVLPDLSVGRLAGLPALEPALDCAVDDALAIAEIKAIPVQLPGWRQATRDFYDLLGFEARQSLSAYSHECLGADVRAHLEAAACIDRTAARIARAGAVQWRQELDTALEHVGVVVLPTLPIYPPRLGGDASRLAWFTAAVNLSGNPAISLPVRSTSGDPASLQIIGKRGSEGALVALARRIEAATC
jgi:amidase